ncbi:type II secretion system minor pseudopilin GspK [Undibacterium sp. RTI2.1]|nr:type II secretion system minor pseudopilin GspK [Undibacterium sp. RTI2.1]MEB0117874.1 type II secretion system minor pseudopilin GspK [Undibacterium sp. RTI2.2]MEB0231651.1 type II secretion system minor pseudopilin GspK [Undibacterium sp. 10I3]MEB0258662.1 type II secretion system minor pseudopilin GspK [Undibacterium sp. 5I1]
MPQHQSGVAVVTALLLTTLAITIVASLFWQQQVQVRSIENQRLQLQKKWVLRGALDWARLILREDGRGRKVDHLKEAWATPLAETRLDEYVENGRADTEASDATLSGQITDAQSRFNINNLATNGIVNPKEVLAFERLLTNVKLDPSLAAATATAVANSQTKKVSANASGPATVIGAVSGSNATDASIPTVPNTTDASKSTSNANQASTDTIPEVQFLRFTQIDDVLSVPGFTSDMLLKLRDFVTVLPHATPINVNTASAEVLSARITALSLSDAAAIIASRDRAEFLDIADFKQRFPDKLTDISANDVSVATDYFIAAGKIKLGRSTLNFSALIERIDIVTKIIWIREL